MGHLPILMFTVGTLLFNAQLIISIITLQSIYTLIYVLFSHYRMHQILNIFSKFKYLNQIKQVRFTLNQLFI